MKKSIIKLSIIVILYFSTYILLSQDISKEDEILNKLSDCISKKSKKSEIFSENRENENQIVEIPKKDNSCSRETIKLYFQTISDIEKSKNNSEKIQYTIFIGIFTILGIILYFRQKRKITFIENKLNESLETIHSILESSTAKFDSSVTARVLNLEARQFGVEETLDMLVTQTRNLPSKDNQFKSSEPEIREIFYMTFPKTDGTFPQSSKRKNKENTIYAFFPINEIKAEFELSYDKDMLGRILNSSEIYIEPACESVNPLDFGALQIITIEKGEALKEGNTWVISKKAKIRYD